MSSFQGVGIGEFHCTQRCPHFRGMVPLYTGMFPRVGINNVFLRVLIKLFCGDAVSLAKGSPHVSGIPPPPPLPPVPCVPLPPPLPPPHNSSSSLHTTSFRDHSTSHAGNETGSDHSRDILNQMQSRLRNRITRRGTRKDGGSVRGGDLNNGDTKEVDIKV